MTTDRVPAGIMEKRPFLCLAEKCFFGQKSVFPKKRSKIFKKTDIYFGKGYFLVCTIFPGRGQKMVRTKKQNTIDYH